ncbi:outer membrane beta-barrel protein [Hymenobacter sp. M29]|uniref:Outer membrane beta-barrel protein n=1 Tax=Hymenobacter mellowenesis TaxID=3063995 RepID=A0ABT9AJR2_9BACT|nr:outer membrane beta-barrel protein [Hymenobacter sp. M29]MDO7848977.1 outer membrane beta-barrel protein [Hymenobacter sp. M29]
MKKVLLFALLAASAQASHAQSIAAGTVSLGGSVGYSRNTGKYSYTQGSTSYTQETTSSQFTFTPSVGYFVKDNLAIGLNAGYSAYRKSYTSYTPAPTVVRAELDPTTTLRLGAYVQYYKMLTEQFGVLGTLSGGYQSSRDSQYNGNVIQEFKNSGYYAELTPGIIFFPIPKLGISASIGSLAYNHLSYDYPTASNNPAPAGYESTASTFGARFGLDQLLFGGTYYFGH